MKYFFFLILLSSNLSISQAHFNIKDYNGIWIAEDFYNSFEKSNSIIKSKKAFSPDAPVGIRVNNDELKGNILNIGFSSLHDHLLRPEVSEYLVNKKDTILEQGSFKINLSENNGYNQFRTSEIELYNDYKSIITFKGNRITLYTPSNNKYKSKTIRYIRVNKRFKANYKYPNPIYYYTRSKLLTGTYVLKDSSGTIVSNNLQIQNNGLMSGFTLFNNKYIYYSTDVFCGPPTIDSYVIICDEIKSLFQDDSFGFVFKKKNKSTIYLYDTYPREKLKKQKEALGIETYRLIKKYKQKKSYSNE